MRRALTLLFVIVAMTCSPGIGQATHPTRHYLNGLHGLTRSTYYLPTGYRTASGAWPRWGLVGAPYAVPMGAVVVLPGLGVFTVADRGNIYGPWIDVFLPYVGYRFVPDFVRGAYWY